MQRNFVCLLFLALAVPFTPSGRAADVAPEKVEKIMKGLPTAAVVKPAQLKSVLVYTRASGFVHGSIPIGAKAFELLGKQTGAFEVTAVTDDPAVFDPERLNKFDGVVLLSTTGRFLFPGKGTDEEKKAAAEREPIRKQALLDFVAGGKGVVGIHAATDAYYDWKEYGELMGGYFKSHPYGKIKVRIEDPKSPLNAQFEGKDFEFQDEIYVFRDQPYSRDNLRVLLSVDVEGSNITNQARDDKDYAVAWIRQHGKGRVFYTLLGHRDETYYNPLSLKYMLTGMQYALGDLPADATPSGKLKGQNAP